MSPLTSLSRLSALAAAAVLLLLPHPSVAAEAQESPDELAAAILAETGVRGGLIVHVGCGDGQLTAALRANDSYLVHGLDRHAADVERARGHLRERGLGGPVSVAQWDGMQLPYIDNLANLVVAEQAVPMEEVMRVLAPGGVAYVKTGAKWERRVKERPEALGEWTHYLHDASNNAVGHDSVVGPPRRMQWVGSPKYTRHHDRMSSMSAAVTAGGRVFNVFDEASTASILLPPKWTLIARDAFNGTILWKRKMGHWQDHLWPLKSGPAQLPRRLVADGERVYITLSLGGPIEALDAATGETIRTYEETTGAEEMVLSGGVLFAVVNNIPGGQAEAERLRRRGIELPKEWKNEPKVLTAILVETGEVLWTSGRKVVPGTLGADPKRVVLNDGECVVSLDRRTGDELWRSEPVARCDVIPSFYLPTLVLYEDVVLYAGGETAGKQTGSWYEKGKDTMTALSAETGEVLWSAHHPPSGYRSPEDILVAGGLVWTGETTSGRAVGMFTGRDLHTGEVKKEFAPGVDTYWFHHRCYRGKATDKYLLMARTGTEFIDVRDESWTINHWIRGACLYGIMPANGLLYAPQNPCACYQEAKSMGFNALAPESGQPRVPVGLSGTERLEKGPAYGKAPNEAVSDACWPTYRHDTARSGHASTSLPAALDKAWTREVGGRLSSPVVAGDRLYIASIDEHTVYALDAASGEELWHYTAGGRVDSPPTIHGGLVLFGCADGYVYALRASDGVLAWRFLAAPMDQRLTAFEQVESVWPVHGSVLVRDGTLYCVAGRSMFLDGGLLLWRLDAETGRVLSKTPLESREAGTGKDIQDFISWLNMPTALPDVLSTDGKFVYMRSQPFNLDGTRLPLKAMPSGGDADKGAPPPTQDWQYAHLFSPTGFLDDAYFHRTYWMYGSTFVSGWCGYYLAGKVVPAGRILVFDADNVYGFGRLPQYYKWTTPIEHQLFAAGKHSPPPLDGPPPDAPLTLVRVAKSESLKCGKKPVTVEAWVNPTPRGGIVVARGGNVLGFALYLTKGRPCFAIRSGGTPAYVRAAERIEGRWAHLVGVLTAAGEMQLYIDGQLAGSAKAPGLIANDPSEAMEIGADDGTAVGDYSGPFTMEGVIDEVVVYDRALTPAEVERRFARAEEMATAPEGAVLAFTFDDGSASDASGNGNEGAIQSAKPVKGRFGQALRFSGGGRQGSDFMVDHHWTSRVPVFARAITLADGTLYVAGPPDTLDEEEAFRSIGSPETDEHIAAYEAALAGREGGKLWVASAADGGKEAEYGLAAPPVFDGLIAADGRLYIALTDGSVVCMTGAREARTGMRTGLRSNAG